MKRFGYLLGALLWIGPLGTLWAQSRPTTPAPSGFTIQLDAPEEIEPPPPPAGHTRKAAAPPSGRALTAPKKKKLSAKERKARKKAAKARKRAAKAAKKKKAREAKRRRIAERKARKKARRKARKEARKKARADAKRKARARRVAKRKARAERRRTRARKRKARTAAKSSQPKPTSSRVVTRKAAAPRMKASPGKRSARNGKKRAKPQIVPFLNGFGADYARQTPWGMVEAVDTRTAARIRSMVDGPQRTYERPVIFEPYRARLTPDTTGMLAALSDYLKASKEIMLVMIEGHAEDFDDPAKDHTLSEARASAVREFLVKRGIDANRTIAYGVGRSQPAHSESHANHRVLLHLVSGNAVSRPAAQTWNQLAIARLTGERNAFFSTGSEAEWAPVPEKLQLSSPARLKTGADTDVVLRAPSGSRFQVQEKSVVHVARTEFSPSTAAIEMSLESGQMKAVNDPNFTGRGTLELAVAGAQFSGTSMNMIARAIAPNRGWVSVVRGVAQVRLSSGLSMKIGAGQIVHLDAGQPSVWAQLEAPVVTSPTHGSVNTLPPLTWQPVRGAVAYQVELSADVEAYRVIKRVSVTDTQFDAGDLIEPGRTFYWRVVAIDERATPGRMSKTFRVKRTLRAED